MTGLSRTKEKIKDKKVIIASHVYTTGPSQDLTEYLRNKEVARLIFIGHPLFYDPKLKGSGYSLYEKGCLLKEEYGEIKRIPDLLAYSQAFFLNLYWIIREGKKWDWFIGADCLNAVSGFFLQKLGLVDKTVYYVIDYNPRRFHHRLLNWIYHRLDHFCVKNCDETWNLSSAMEEARKKYFNFSCQKQKTVPIGAWFKRIKRLPFSQVDRNTLVFMGHITKKQGIQNVMKAFPHILQKIPNLTFLVIGGGDYLEKLKEQAKELGIGRQVKFTGFVEKHEEVESLLTHGAAAIALYEKYNPDESLTFTNFSDPGKIKTYLAAGLPVILTAVPPNAREIVKNHCGVITKSGPKDIADIVINFMKSKRLESYRKNAIKYAQQFDWEIIFEKALKSVL